VARPVERSYGFPLECGKSSAFPTDHEIIVRGYAAVDAREENLNGGVAPQSKNDEGKRSFPRQRQSPVTNNLIGQPV
jgi:hypothetical protein